MKYSIKIILTTFLFLLIIVFAFSIFSGYKVCLEYVISVINQKQNSEKIFGLITLNKFRYLQTLLIFIFILIGFSLYYFKHILNFINLCLRELYFSINQAIQRVLKSEIKYLLIIPILSSIYFAFYLPVSYDEAYTYLNFTSKSILSSISYYPAPNNHILHSFITNFTKYCPFLSPLMCLRIPSIFANIFTWILTYSFITKYFNKNTALIVVSIASMLFMSVYYSYMSRGYALLSLFFMIAFVSSFNIVKENNQTKHWVWFLVSSILGFYTMPSFLYPFITLNVFIFIFNYKNILKQTVINIVISVIVFFLYLPIIIINGLEALTNNKFVTPIPRTEALQKLPAFFLNSIAEITGLSWTYIISLLLLSFILLLIKRKKEDILIYLLFIISPFILLTIHSVIPFSRTFIYYGFILVFLIALPLSDFFQKIKYQYLLISLLLIQSTLLYNFYSNIFTYENYNITSNSIIKEIEGNKKYLCNSGLFDALLLFELETKGYNNAKMKYYGSIEMSADSMPNYDFIIIDKPIDKSIKKNAKYKTAYHNVY
jgi:Dolichyl-phosphate-mannose-protein mannosyltransferase